MPGFSKTEEAAMDGFLELIETTEGQEMTEIYMTEAGKLEDPTLEVEMEGAEWPLTVRVPGELVQDGRLTESFFELQKMLDDARREVYKTEQIKVSVHEVDYLIGIMEQMGETDLILQPMVEYVLTTLARKVHQNARDKGWHDTGRELPEEVALIHSEVSEWLEEYRDGHGPEEHYYRDKDDTLHDTFMDWDNPFPNEACRKPEGQAAEAADVLIRLLDTCGNPDRAIDLARGVWEKHQYNRTRPMRHGGKVC